MEERLKLAVAALDAEGRGVARTPDGKVAFVEGALPGEVVEAELVRRRSSFDLMRTVAILRESSARQKPRCPYFGVCGGCATQHADTRTQVAAKQRGLEDCLARIGKVSADSLLAPLYGEDWGYRQRARLSVRYVASKGGALVGFRERRSTFVADMTSCEVLAPRVSALIPLLRSLVGRLAIRERVPQIEVAAGDDATILVFRHLLPLDADDRALLLEFARSSGVHVWLQPGGPDTAHPFAPADSSLAYSLPEFGIRISFRPTDFTQVNRGMNRALVSRAVRLLDPQPGERVGDLFCGLGNFSLPIATLGAAVVGIEASPHLVERARQNAEANGLAARAAFECEDLFANPRKALELGPFEKLLVDPPREGAIEPMKALPPNWPRRIVYVSCDPATLARDAGLLVHTKGFRLVAAGVVNMFPHTAHVESIALFER